MSSRGISFHFFFAGSAREAVASEDLFWGQIPPYYIHYDEYNFGERINFLYAKKAATTFKN